jgi:indolepyruvate ferredoxin oxidoreductase
MKPRPAHRRSAQAHVRPLGCEGLPAARQTKGLRGTPLDIFAHTPERKIERRLIADYETTVEALLPGLDRDNHAIACEIAALPETIRGFGPVKERNLETAKAREVDLLDAYRRPAPKATAAEYSGSAASPAPPAPLAPKDAHQKSYLGDRVGQTPRPGNF